VIKIYNLLNDAIDREEMLDPWSKDKIAVRAAPSRCTNSHFGDDDEVP
jgi:hypothetical protein